MKLIKELIKKIMNKEFLIIFRETGGGTISVYSSCGKRATELGWDEALGSISYWLIKKECFSYFKTKSQEDAWNKKYRSRGNDQN